MKIESIVNEVSVEFHDELNPALWQNNDIKLDVQVRLLEIAKKFITFLNIPNLNLVDIYFIGSNAAYVYTQFSDIDLHIIVDDPNDSLKELYDAKKRLWNEQRNITIKGYDVEVYVQDIKEPNASMGIYSLLKNAWIKEPEKVEATIDDTGVQEKFKYLSMKIMRGIKKRDLDYLNKVASEVKDLRKSGLQRAGEFSVENLAFKELRNGGYLEKLSNARRELEDVELSLDETLKKVKGRWALVSRKDPSKVLQYYRGSGHPSKDWVSGVERRIHSFSEEINEAPVSDYQTLGDFDKPGSFTTTKYDPAIVKNPKAQQKVYRFFERSPYKFRLYPLNIPGARKFMETGRVNLDWLTKNLPEAAEIVKKNPPDDDIIVFYLSNVGSEKVPFTPWIMAHRMGHAFRPNNYAWGEYVNYWMGQMKQMLNGYYGAEIGRMEDPRYIALQNALGTMKSARENKITRPYEFLYELLAQYINTGEIKLNSMPKVLGYGKQAWGKHARFIRLLPTDDAENQNHIEMLERDLAHYLDTILGEAQNKIFVM